MPAVRVPRQHEVRPGAVGQRRGIGRVEDRESEGRSVVGHRGPAARGWWKRLRPVAPDDLHALDVQRSPVHPADRPLAGRRPCSRDLLQLGVIVVTEYAQAGVSGQPVARADQFSECRRRDVFIPIAAHVIPSQNCQIDPTQPGIRVAQLLDEAIVQPPSRRIACTDMGIADLEDGEPLQGRWKMGKPQVCPINRDGRWVALSRVLVGHNTRPSARSFVPPESLTRTQADFGQTILA